MPSRWILPTLTPRQPNMVADSPLRMGPITLAMGVLVIFLMGPVEGQDRIFNGSSGSNWSDAANWTPNDVPDTASENAIIGPGGAFTVSLDGSFTVGDLTIGVDDQLDQQNSRDFTVEGSLITNDGLYRMLDVGSVTDLIIASSQVNLSGSGELQMSNSGNNRIFGSSASNLLVNGVGHTISGGGSLGSSALSVTNNGLIRASVGTLTIDPGAGEITNQATMEANGGVLSLRNGIFNNMGGTIQALGGSEVQFGVGAAIEGGELIGDGNPASLLRVTAGNVSFTNVTNETRLAINNSRDPILAGTFTNNGQVNQNDVGSVTDVLIDGAVTLAGNGTWTMSSSNNNRWQGRTDASDTLTNGAAHTIEGAGQVGADGLGIINEGVIVANLASGNRLTIDPGNADVDGSGANVLNDGLLLASNDGFLRLQGGVFNNASGMIRATQAAEVELHNGATIIGGSLSTDADPNSLLRVNGQNVTLRDVTLSGKLAIDNLFDPILLGTFTNNGQVNQNDLGSLTDVQIDGAVTLAGNGVWQMSNSANNRWYGRTGASDTLTNSVAHTIQGAGQVGTDGLGIINQGVIDANLAGNRLVIDPGDANVDGSGADVLNSNLLRASNDGFLRLQGGVFNNASGTIRATQAAEVELDNGATIIGGSLSTDADPNSLLRVNGQNVTLRDVTLSGKLAIDNAFDPILLGTFTNNGQVSQNDLGSLTDVKLSGDVTVNGNGTWTMSNSNNNRWYGLTTGTEVLTNGSNHTIAGGGRLGDGGMGLRNNGKINANNGTLTIAPSDVDLGIGADVVNNGTLEANAGGTLRLSGGLFQNNNRIIAGNGSAVNLNGGVHLSDGNLATSGTGIFVVDGPATLDDVTLTLGSRLRINNAQDPILVGTITNRGQIDQNDLGSLTDIQISGDVTLAGEGIWTMSTSTNNRWYGLVSGDETLTNGVGHTIQGRGQIGTNFLRITNQGLIDANNGSLLVDPSDAGSGVAAVVNAGTLRASGGGTLTLAGAGGGEFSNPGIIEALDGSTVVSDGIVQQVSASTVTAGTYRAVNGTLNIAPAGYQPSVNRGEIEVFGSTANNDVLGVKTGNDHLNENLSLNEGRILIGGGANLTLTTPVAGGLAVPLLVPNSGEVAVGAGSTLDVSSRSTIFTVPSDTTVAGLHVDQGTLRGSGTIDGGVYMPAGLLSPGDAEGLTGLLSIVGDFNMDDPDVLIEDALTLIELGGYTRGTQYDSFDATGDFFGQGELRATLVNGFLPNIGDEFVIATYVEDGNVNGNLWDNYTFNRVQFSLVDRSLGGQARETVMTVLDIRDIDFDGDLAFNCSDVDALVADIVAGSNTPMFDLNFDGVVDQVDLEVWLTDAGASNLASGQAYLPGDADLNGVVDVSDFNIWNINKFSNTPAWCSGDFNANGFVDTSDFNIWNNNKFRTSGIITFASVPEPSGIWLLMVAAAVLLRRLR